MTEFRYCPQCADKLVQKDENGETRMACPCCDFVHYDNPTPVVAMIVQHGDDIILVRNVGWPEKWFGIVSGFLERNETPEDAARREVCEELGSEPIDTTFIGVYAFEAMNQVVIAYHGYLVEPPVPDPKEIEAIKRVPVKKLRPWPMGTGHAVKDWLATL